MGHGSGGVHSDGPRHLEEAPYPPLWANHKTVAYIEYAVVLQFTHIDESETSSKCRGPLQPELLFHYNKESGYICWEEGQNTCRLILRGSGVRFEAQSQSHSKCLWLSLISRRCGHQRMRLFPLPWGNAILSWKDRQSGYSGIGVSACLRSEGKG